MHSTRLILITAMLVLPAIAFSSGCRRTMAPYRVEQDPYLPSQVQLADRTMQQRLRFDPPRADRDEAGLLHVTVPVRAATPRPQIVQYRFTFFDETGRPLPGGQYRTATLESNTFGYLTANSTTPRAADFQVEIRQAR